MMSEATGLMRTVLTPAFSIFLRSASLSSVPAATTGLPVSGFTASSRRICPTSGMTGSSTTSWEMPRRYGVSMNPYWLILPYVASDPMSPMFGPSGVSIGQMRP